MDYLRGPRFFSKNFMFLIDNQGVIFVELDPPKN